jgi:ABC-2 type transport system permease protein
MTAVLDAQHMMVRHLRALLRQPWWIAVTLVQPVIWLLLFGALFKKVVEIPGFHSGSYIEFLVPGVVMMTAFFAAGWGGMPVIEDLERGIVDRFLVSPVHHGALIWGRILQNSVTIAIQSVIIVLLALVVGATFSGGVGGVAMLTLIAAILGAGFGALSIGLALLARREESLIATMQFLLLPLTFLSAAFMQRDLMPGWMQTVSDFNPVQWAVEAGRSVMAANPDWGLILSRTGILVAFAIVCSWFATRAFTTYQRSV